MAAGSLSFIDFTHTYRLAGFPGVKALSGVSVSDLQPGEIVCIVGPNGAGKSTFLLSVAGLLSRKGERGQIELDGVKISSQQIRTAFIPQKPSDSLVSDLSLIENFALRRSSYGWPTLRFAVTRQTRDDINGLLSEFGFDKLLPKLHMPPTALSGGQQQLFNALAAIHAQADLLLCDEPTSKLDEQNRIRVAQLLLQLAHTRNTPIVLSTHDLDLVQKIADRVVYLADGQVRSEVRMRLPGTSRPLPEIRLAPTISDLGNDLQNIDDAWWTPGTDRLFGSAYRQGDDSVEGYLSGTPMSLEERTRREVKAVIRLCDLVNKPNASIADIPCGWGRHSLELARRGYNVCGVDFSGDFISEAATSAREAELGNVDFSTGNMRNLKLEADSFDAVINIWTSFGFFGQKDDLEVLKQFHRILVPGGRALIHSDLNPLRIKLGIFDEPSVRELNSGSTLEVTEWFCQEDNCVYGKWKIQEPESTHSYRIRLYDTDDWQRMASDSGLEIVQFLGSLDHDKIGLTDRSTEFVVLLRKP